MIARMRPVRADARKPDAGVSPRLAAQSRAPAQPRLEFRSEFLHAYTHTERVRSDKPVTLTRGNDRFTADSMDYDNLYQVLQLR